MIKEFNILRVAGAAGLSLAIFLTLSACSGNIPDEQLNFKVDPAFSSLETDEGVAAFEEGNYELAYQKLKPNSDKGVAMAQNILGRMYLQGQGVPKNTEIALDLFRKAADQGLANAQSNLGVMYASGQGVSQDYYQAIFWFEKSAKQGFKVAMSNLADMYENGLGVAPDKVKAEHWRAKSKGLSPAKPNEQVKIKTVSSDEFKEGLEYYYSWNFEGAAKLFLQAARNGHPEAQYLLSTMYKYGQGVAQDEVQAQFWEQEAAKQGHGKKDGRDRIIIIDSSKIGAPSFIPAGASGISGVSGASEVKGDN